MEQTKLDRWHPPIKTPAIEIVDLLSDHDEISETTAKCTTVTERDASEDSSVSEGSQSSLWEDILNAEDDNEELTSSTVTAEKNLVANADSNIDEEACSLEEALAFRKRLRLVGEDQFLAETVEAGTITAKKLCTALGIRFPFFLDGQPDEAYHYPLRLGICRELSKRRKLPQYNTIEDAVTLLKESHNIIVLTGAGVS